MEGNRKLIFREATGNIYNIGVAQGEVFRNDTQMRSREYRKALEDKDIRIKLKDIKGRLQGFCPEIIEEISGRAAGAKVDFEEMLLTYSPELMGSITGCTTIVYREKDHIYLFHNEDDDYTPENVGVFKFTYSNGSWTMGSIPSLGALGLGFTCNSRGMIFAMNYTFPIGINLEGVSRYALIRKLIECGSIGEIERICRKTICASGFHLFIIDKKENEAYSLEVDRDKVSIIRIDDHFIHSNHYVHDKIANGRVCESPTNNSLFRYNKAVELYNNLSNHTVEDIKNILLYKGDNNMNSILQTSETPNITFSTSVFDSKSDSFTLDCHMTGEKFVIKY